MLGIDGFNFRFWEMGFCEKTWNEYDIEAFWLILWRALSPIFVVICEFKYDRNLDGMVMVNQGLHS